MNTQTFRAPDVMTALEAVQKQLGANAVVVSVRQVPNSAPWQVWRSPEVEVVAMQQPGAKQPAQPVPVAATLSTTVQEKLETLISAANLTSSVEINKQSSTAAAPMLPSALAGIRKRLLAQGVDSELVTQLAKTCLETLSPRALKEEVRLYDYIQHQLEAYIRCRPPLEARQGTVNIKDRIICLIGMSGAGRTSMIAKLAAYHSKGLGRKVAWICADTVSAGAVAQARLYTDALTMPLHLVYSPQELAAAVASECDADLILVDTPSCNPYHENSMIELGDLLTAVPERATYLVVSANSKEADLKKVVTAFSPFNLKGMVITHLDTTGTFGNVMNLAWRSQLPLIYFTAGARIPEDLQPAQAAHLVGALFSEEWPR
jgi:flagellar biosynthesis protein FlhF